MCKPDKDAYVLDGGLLSPLAAAVTAAAFADTKQKTEGWKEEAELVIKTRTTDVGRGGGGGGQTAAAALRGRSGAAPAGRAVRRTDHKLHGMKIKWFFVLRSGRAARAMPFPQQSLSRPNPFTLDLCGDTAMQMGNKICSDPVS